MDVPILDHESFWWAIGLAVAFPAAMLVLGEAILRLRRGGRPMATTLGHIRDLVLPPLALSVLLTHVIGLSREHVTTRVVDTLLWIALIHTALSFFDDVIFADPVEGSWQSRVPRLFLDVTRFVLILIGGGVVLSSIWRLPLDKFVTALGVGSLVLGLALQEPLGNVFAGVVLMFERPFAVGDWINVAGTIGRVIEINWRAVHLETGTLELLVVPNSTLAKGNVSNYSRSNRRYTETIVLTFSGDDPPNKVRRVLVETALATPGILDVPSPTASTSDYQDGKVVYKLRFTVPDFAGLGPARDDLLTRLWYAARREGLAIPPQSRRDVAHPDLAELLADFPHFGVKEPEVLAEIAPLVVVESYGRGEVVVQAGHRAEGLHLVLSGSASMAIEGPGGWTREVGRVGRGEFFGENSVLSGEPSDVTIVAVEDLDVMVLDSRALQIVLDRTPRLAREIGKVMDVRRKEVQAARGLRATAS